MHEKLTQLMKDLDVYNCDECQNCEAYKYGLDCDDDCFCGKVADYLIGNDVVERKRGEWDEDSYPFCNVCKSCNAIVERGCVKWSTGDINFCPNCGSQNGGHYDGQGNRDEFCVNADCPTGYGTEE